MGSGLSREASATSAYTPPAEVVSCSLSLACATVVGSCVKPTTLSIREMAIPAERSVSRYITPLQHEAGYKGEDKGVGCEH